MKSQGFVQKEVSTYKKKPPGLKPKSVIFIEEWEHCKTKKTPLRSGEGKGNGDFEMHLQSASLMEIWFLSAFFFSCANYFMLLKVHFCANHL